MKRMIWTGIAAAAAVLLSPADVQAMHIMEGFLPLKWCLFWYAICLPFVIAGLISISRKLADHPELKLLLGVAGAFAFVLSALKIPSVTGSSSHPTGVGLGAVLFGPCAMSVIGSIVLLFQAILLAHGGITTLGANVFSMAVVGTFSAYYIYHLAIRLGLSSRVGIFLAACLGDLLTYITTALQLAVAFPAADGGMAVSAVKFLSIFALTQIPLAISEGLLTVIVFNFLTTYSQKELSVLQVFTDKGKKGA